MRNDEHERSCHGDLPQPSAPLAIEEITPRHVIERERDEIKERDEKIQSVCRVAWTERLFDAVSEPSDGDQTARQNRVRAKQ